MKEKQAEGRAAQMAGTHRSENPYQPDSDEWMFWMEGFDEAQTEQERHPGTPRKN